MSVTTMAGDADCDAVASRMCRSNRGQVMRVAGVSQSTVYNLLRRKRPISQLMLDTIRGALDILDADPKRCYMRKGRE